MLKQLLNKIHILQNIYLKNKYFIKKKSYAMDGEDIAIDQYIEKKEKGFYVDIGAHHPIHRNNTQLLFNKGWSGINIDVNQFSIDLFNFLRPKDLNLLTAISDREGEVFFYYQKLINEHGVQMRQLPDSVMNDLGQRAGEVVSSIASKDPVAQDLFSHIVNQ